MRSFSNGTGFYFRVFYGTRVSEATTEAAVLAAASLTHLFFGKSEFLPCEQPSAPRGVNPRRCFGICSCLFLVSGVECKKSDALREQSARPLVELFVTFPEASHDDVLCPNCATQAFHSHAVCHPSGRVARHLPPRTPPRIARRRLGAAV